MATTKALLVKYGEIALRGGNRKIFEDKLIDVIKSRIKKFGEFSVRKDQGRFFIETNSDSGSLDTITETVSKIFGLAGVCPCVKTDDQSLENLKTLSLAHMIEHFGGEQSVTFKADVSRADKSYPYKSGDVAAIIGEHLLENIPALKVDLSNPQVRLRIELRSSAYIYSKAFKGPGGLPPGSGGKGVLLLSGGFDSPVAGYLSAKRGVELACVYFHSPPYTSERAKEKVSDLAQKLSEYTGKIRLYTVHFTDTQLYLNEHVPEVKLTLFLKRAMLKAGNIIAGKENAQALITGDSIGQVASQTMQAIQATDSASDLAVLRPLCGMDKLEILNIAEKIGTFEISARPFADCCTLFVAKHPETKPKRSIIESMEKKLIELDGLIQSAVDTSEITEF